MADGRVHARSTLSTLPPDRVFTTTTTLDEGECGAALDDAAGDSEVSAVMVVGGTAQTTAGPAGTAIGVGVGASSVVAAVGNAALAQADAADAVFRRRPGRLLTKLLQAADTRREVHLNTATVSPRAAQSKPVTTRLVCACACACACTCLRVCVCVCVCVCGCVAVTVAVHVWLWLWLLVWLSLCMCGCGCLGVTVAPWLISCITATRVLDYSPGVMSTTSTPCSQPSTFVTAPAPLRQPSGLSSSPR